MRYKTKGSLKKNYGGGGGTSTSTVSSIPDWAVPYMQNVGQAAESAYGAGELGKVAGPSQLQQHAFTAGAQNINDTTNQGLGVLADQGQRVSALASRGQDPMLAASNYNIGAATANNLGTLANQGQRLSGIAGSGIDTAASEGLIGRATNSMSSQADRLTNMAMAPSEATLAAQKQNILYEAQKKVAGLNTGFGQQGTLGSARQAVMQGAQNAETVGHLAKVDADYEMNMFKNRLAAEGALSNTQTGTLDAAKTLAGLRSTDVNTRLAAEQAIQQGATASSNIAEIGAAGLERSVSNQYKNQLSAEDMLQRGVSGASSIAGSGASGIANLGNQQRGIDQQGLDATYQGLQRYASTIYGNPAKQQAVTSGGGK